MLVQRNTADQTLAVRLTPEQDRQVLRLEIAWLEQDRDRYRRLYEDLARTVREGKAKVDAALRAQR